MLDRDGCTVAVRAGEVGGKIIFDGELPELELLLVVARLKLSAGDLVDEPLGFASFGDVLNAVSVDDVADEPVAIDLLGAGKLVEIRFRKRLGHGVASLSDGAAPIAAPDAVSKAIADKQEPHRLRAWPHRESGAELQGPCPKRAALRGLRAMAGRRA